MTKSLDDLREQWESTTLAASLQRRSERRESFETSSGIAIERVYLPGWEDPEYVEKLGFPGEYPFTRGAQASMYRGRLWTMRQYAGYASAAETNQRFRYLLEQGQTGLSVAFDLPTQIGYDADDPLSHGEVGRVGVSISSLDDMVALFQEIPLDKASTSMTINAPAAILLSMYVAVAHRQGVDPKALRGTIQNDILKEYIARGTYIFPPEPSMRLITDAILYCREHLPKWNPISISGYHIREAGSTAVQEVAFTLANAIAYVESALAQGLEIDEFAPRLAFFFSADRNFLEEIAKFRAARRLWAKIMRNRFSAQDPNSARMRFHTQTAGSSLTAQQPENNIVRVALQALSAVLGGTQSLHTNSMDEALGLPSQTAVQLALRTQQIIAHESGVTDSVDPLAGSYALESLTDEIETRASEYIRKIDELGGALPAIQSGYIQREIQDSAYKTQRAIEDQDEIVVGVNQYTSDEPVQIAPLKVDPRIEQEQRQKLDELRSKRDSAIVDQCLGEVARRAHSTDNLIPAFIECLEADVTLGEICGVLRNEWGEFQPNLTV